MASEVIANNNQQMSSALLSPQAIRDAALVRYYRLLAVKRRENIFRIARAITFSLLAFSVATLFFLLSAKPQHMAFWLQTALLLATLSLAASPLVISRLSFQRERRLHLVRKLYASGLRLDDEDNLVTDEVHERTVCQRC